MYKTIKYTRHNDYLPTKKKVWKCAIIHYAMCRLRIACLDYLSDSTDWLWQGDRFSFRSIVRVSALVTYIILEAFYWKAKRG